MKITAIRATTIRLPIYAPVRHSFGSHAAFARTLVEVDTDEGITGVSETLVLPQEAFRETEELVVGEDVFDLERIQMKITYAGYISRQAWIAAAIEIACLDIQGKALGLPVSKLLGGTINETIPTAAYLFYRYDNEQGDGAVTTNEDLVAHALELKERHGFETFKLKAGVFPPQVEVDAMGMLRSGLGPEAKLRIDPNACWTPQTGAQMGIALEPHQLEYYEDPSWGIAGMARVREKVRIPTATNMCVVWFDQIAPAVQQGAVDVILSDPWYWGGPRNTRHLAKVCDVLGLGVGMHSGLESGVGMAAMLHTAATMPNLTHAIDAHYHHLTDDVLEGGLIPYKDGAMTPPAGPGLGVTLDQDKVAQLAEAYRKAAEKGARPAPDVKNAAWFPRYPRW